MMMSTARYNYYHQYAQQDFTLLDQRLGTLEELRAESPAANVDHDRIERLKGGSQGSPLHAQKSTSAERSRTSEGLSEINAE